MPRCSRQTVFHCRHSHPFNAAAHLAKVRAKLLSETASIDRAEQAKKQRDIKKFGKKVCALPHIMPPILWRRSSSRCLRSDRRISPPPWVCPRSKPMPAKVRVVLPPHPPRPVADIKNKLSNDDDDEFSVQTEAARGTQRPARGGKPVSACTVQ